MTWRAITPSTSMAPVWICNECGEAHDNSESALDCCESRKLRRAYECSDCQRLHSDDFDATMCCEEKKAEETTAWVCPKCGDYNETAGMAKSCCQTSLDAVSGYEEPSQKDAWKCPDCESLHGVLEGALECCGHKKRHDVWQCVYCDGVYDSYSDAQQCCDVMKTDERQHHVCADCGRTYERREDADECCEDVTEEKIEDNPKPRTADRDIAFSIREGVVFKDMSGMAVLDLGTASHHGLQDMYDNERAAALKAWRKKSVRIAWCSNKGSAWVDVKKTPDGVNVQVGVMSDEGDALISDAIWEAFGLTPEHEAGIIEAVNDHANAFFDTVDLSGTHEAKQTGLSPRSDFDEVLAVAEALRSEAETASSDNFLSLVALVREVADDYALKHKHRPDVDAPPVEMGDGDDDFTFENPSTPRDLGEVWESEDWVTEGRCWYVQFPTARMSFSDRAQAERWSHQLKKDLRAGALDLNERLWTPDGVNKRKLPPPIRMDDEDGFVSENPDVEWKPYRGKFKGWSFGKTNYRIVSSYSGRWNGRKYRYYLLSNDAGDEIMVDSPYMGFESLNDIRAKVAETERRGVA